MSGDSSNSNNGSSNRLSGRTAIVTGAGKGIGAGIARRLGVEGANVVVDYAADRGAADEVVTGIRAEGGRAIAVRADVADPEQVAELFSAARAEFGIVDVLVNNAGVVVFGPIESVGVADFRRQVDTNFLGPVLTTQAFAAQPDLAGGVIVNVSTAGTIGLPPHASVYVASKSALEAFTVVSAKELGPRGIRVLGIAPGASDTDGTRALGFVGSEQAVATAAQNPLGRIGVPDDYAPVVAFLVSDEARWITGDVLLVSGGQR
ncbi:SDR family oxidoreductase [Actinosynnema pretiosum subsp. pretiosum]|uniref:SDR family oxidoreductase n=1 Tax=Actinosynnema pretiosum subsp. pretiosum TaxID=103721 RepID=A0AA45R5C7_9PSEU|nr:3-oxoacyl-[acyl-carrier protein] reductase [Actinosynnema pretiosum subsp. pretiosum]QUF05538.1 SDR family oxidoreductase [Actinosynnema pretiosum subsp. pretiosum]